MFVKLESGLERSSYRACRGHLVQARHLLVAERPTDPDCDVEFSWRRPVVVGDVDVDVAEVPVFRVGVLREGDPDARRERGGEELVRRWPAVRTAELFRFVGNQPKSTVDQNVLAKPAV
jgi:hypothetical protein